MYNDFKEFILLLNKHQVKYLIVGGYAVSIYARPRNTDDMDFWIETEEENARKVLEVLQDFGFGELDISIKDLTRKDFVIQLGQPPIRIDILTGITGLDFKNAYKKKEIREFSGISKVYFISYEDLIDNKTKSNRPKDIDALNWMRSYGKSS